MSDDNPIRSLVACIRARQDAEALLARATELEKGARERFYTAAMLGGCSAHQCDIAWVALKQKAEMESTEPKGNDPR